MPPAHDDGKPLRLLFRRHTPRPRLTKLLDESTAQSIVITAPAGYGKTTLALEWLGERDDAVWYRASSSSADLAAFSAGLADVIAPLVPNAGERLRQRLRIADQPERAARPLAELLSEDLANWPTGALLVLDDYQLVMESEPVEDFVDWLLTLTPGLRVLATTRRRPRWASARRVLYGELTEMGREQLAMTHEEAARVLGNRSSESVRALLRQAEGWPALIGLAALSASADIPTERVSDALFRYFAEEVLRSESPDVQRFMLLASIPPTLNVRVAHEVLGFERPEAILDHLVEAGLLHEADSGEFRLHPLLRDFLRRKLETEEPEAVSHLTIQAIDQAAEAGRWEQAIELAATSRRFERMAQLVAQASKEALASGRLETLEAWIAALGEIGLRNSGALVARSGALIRRAHFPEAAVIARNVATGLQDEDPLAPQAWHAAGQALYLNAQSAEALTCHKRALALAKSLDDSKHALWGAFTASVEADPDGSESYLDQLEALSASDLSTQIRVASGRQVLASHRGSLAGIWPTVRPYIALAREAPDPMAGTNLLAHAAYLCAARGDYARGLTLASDALAFCREMRLDFAMGSCLAFQSANEIGVRAFKAARKTLSDLSSLARTQESGYLDMMWSISRLKLALSEGAPERGLREAVPHDYGPCPRDTRAEYLAYRALALAVLADHASVAELISSAREMTSAVESRFVTSYAELIAKGSEMGEVEEPTLASQLFLTSVHHEYLDGFVVAARAYPGLLAALAVDPTCMGELSELLSNSNDHALAKRFGLMPIAVDAGDLLTRRELEVLRLLAEGLTNTEIAEQLVIAPATAKVHVRHIFRKLGARSRVQAAMRARDLA